MTTDKFIARAIKSSIIGIFTNISLAIIKTATGIVGNSHALIADGIESFSDVFSSIIILGGLKLASKPPDENHPYGHGKAEPLAATMVSLGLLAAAIFITVESILEIKSPHRSPEAYTLIVLVAVIIIKEMLFRFVITIGETIESTAVKTDAWHHRADALTSSAAFIGISIALIGGKGYESSDDWAALIASAIITFNALRLLKPAFRDLMDTSPPKELELEIRNSALKVDGVLKLDKCKIRKMGFEYYIDLDIIVDGSIQVRKGHEIAHSVKDTLRQSDPRIANVLIHVEPDVK